MLCDSLEGWDGVGGGRGLQEGGDICTPMSVSKLWELVMDRKPGVLQSMGSQTVGH